MKTLTKQPSESRLYDFNFALKLAKGETVTAVVSIVATPAGLTLGTPSFLASKAQVRISGGTSGVYYKLTAKVTTSLGNALEADGRLSVKDG